MKPPHVPGEGTWGHEMKLVIGDKLRKAYATAVSTSPLVQSSDRKSVVVVVDTNPKSDAAVVGRWANGSGLEDPIRRVMFLGPWSHT